jgi:putative heme-binding domain-containing protein
LLGDPSDFVRAWSIQLLCERSTPAASTLAQFTLLAASDPSPVVRLYLAAALQRLPLEARWAIAGSLVTRDDSSDANLPLMYWYGIEPLVPNSPAKAMQLAAAAKIPLARQFIARRLVEDAVARGEKGDLAPLMQTLAQAKPAEQKDLLLGAREGLAGRKSFKMPAGWPVVYAKLAASEERALRSHAVLLALIFGDPQAIADLRKAVKNAALSVDERREALEALVANRAPELAPLLHEALADKQLRRASLRGLASIPDAATPAKILALYPQLDADVKKDAVATMGSRKDYALALLDGVEKQTVARTDLSAFLARQLYALGDPQVTERLRKVWGEIRDTSPKKQEQIAKYKTMLTAGFLARGDLANGRALYQKTCQNCHRLYGEGGKIGPDITGSNRGNLEYLLGNIVDPSGEIALDYRMSVITTDDGRVITGMVVEKTPNRVTIQTATNPITLPAEEIDEISISPLSMMPEGQLEPFTKEQVRDLIAYLQSKNQVALPAATSGGK